MAAAAATGRGGDRPRLQKARDLDPALSGAQLDVLRLNQFERSEDQNLMRLFWAHGWAAPVEEADFDIKTAKCFLFLSHQFEALRFVAGVPEDWPRQYPPQDWPTASIDGEPVEAWRWVCVVFLLFFYCFQTVFRLI